MPTTSSDITDFKNAALALLYNSADKEQAIRDVLAQTGEHFEALWACVFESATAHAPFINTFEWHNDIVEPLLPRDQSAHCAPMGKTHRANFDENGMFLCNDLSVLPADQQRALEARGIASLVQYAVMDQGEFKGFVSFAYGEHMPPEDPESATRIEALTYVARLLSIALLEHRNREQLRDKAHELQGAYEEAQRASRAKSDFLARVSHDMRTPLNGILGLTKLMGCTESIDDMQTDLVQLEMSARYLLDLVNDTLDVSKIESGQMELHPTVCEGKMVFINTLSLLKPNITAKNITFNVHADDLPFTILNIDVGRVEQLIMNIVGNAVKYTPAGGTVDFFMDNIGREEGFLIDRVTVRDSGIGMSEEFLPHIFEPFSQEGDDIASSKNGTGLGMTISKKIVELMGGEIFVTSAKGVGTEFVFTLKLKLATAEQCAAFHEKRNRQARPLDDLTGTTILLCEDHPLNAQIAQRLLAQQGAIVIWEPDGQAGVDRFANEPRGTFDAVLMDIRMPRMNGLEAMRALRSLENTDGPIIPIIAMTANAFDEDVRKSLASGANAHLAKPFEPEQLFRTLNALIRRTKRAPRDSATPDAR